MANNQSNLDIIQALLNQTDSATLSNKNSRETLPVNPVETWKAELNNLWHLDPAEMAASIDKRCRHCDCLLIPEKKEFNHPIRTGEIVKHLSWPDFCPACGKNISIELFKEETGYDKSKARAGALARLGLPAKLQEKTFAAYKDRPGLPTKEWRQAVADYGIKFVEKSLGQRDWLVLHGSNGLGKTHLPCAMLLSLFDAGHKDFRFIVWPEFCDKIRATFHPSSLEYEEAVKREAKDPSLVVLDDIDKVGMTDWAMGTLYLVINYRLNHGLPTVLSFNWGPGDADPLAPGRLAMVEYIGKATYDRIMERATAIEFKGPSYRTEIPWDEYGKKIEVE